MEPHLSILWNTSQVAMHNSIQKGAPMITVPRCHCFDIRSRSCTINLAMAYSCLRCVDTQVLSVKKVPVTCGDSIFHQLFNSHAVVQRSHRAQQTRMANSVHHTRIVDPMVHAFVAWFITRPRTMIVCS